MGQASGKSQRHAAAERNAANRGVFEASLVEDGFHSCGQRVEIAFGVE
jgi:hypothetical protein